MTRTILRGGELHCQDGDPAQITDVTIENGLIGHIGSVDPAPGDHLVDCAGAFVTPALTDIHTHIYWGATALGVKPEKVARRSGTGVFVDAGSAGAANIEGLKAFIFEPSPFHGFAFLNISFPGIFGFSADLMVGEAEDLRLLNKQACLAAVERHADIIVGIKVRAGRLAAGENGGKALELALEVAEAARLPLMCHVDFEPPTIDTILSSLRSGDILTHCCRPEPNAPVDEGHVREAAWKARERDVRFDVGHGFGGFSFATCRTMLAEGFAPDLISSDIHCLSVDGPAFDVLTTLNKLVALGVDMPTAIASATAKPAAAIGHSELGRIRVGEPTSLAILRKSGQPVSLKDAPGETLVAEEPLVCDGLVVGGRAIDAEGKARGLTELRNC